MTKKQFVPMRIWLQGRQKPIELLASTDCIMGFSDFVNGNYPSNLYQMEYINNNKKRWLVIQQSQVQAYEFDDFDLNEVTG
jgi:hypothetical protein